MMTPAPARAPRRRHRLFGILVALIGAVLVFAVCYFIYHYVSGALGGSPANQEQVVDRVGKLILLPNETPTVAVVSDLSKLQGQAFFAHARVGDVVLMYPQAAKAVLYDPQLNKVIEVAPITGGQP